MTAAKVNIYAPWYAALKAAHPEAYKKAIEFMEGCSMANAVSLSVAVTYEGAAIMLLCDVLGIEPTPSVLP